MESYQFRYLVDTQYNHKYQIFENGYKIFFTFTQTKNRPVEKYLQHGWGVCFLSSVGGPHYGSTVSLESDLQEVISSSALTTKQTTITSFLKK